MPELVSRSGIEFASLKIRASARLVGRATLPLRDRQQGSNLPVEDDIARAAQAKKGSPFLSTEQAAFYLGLSPRKLQSMRADRTGPAFRRHSRYVRYHIDDLDVWSRDSGKRAD